MPNSTGGSSRRRFLRAGATATAAMLPLPAFAKSAPRVVVVGGGFAGATCARVLKQIDPRIRVTLLVEDRSFIACPFSNSVIAGLREMSVQYFSYANIEGAGIAVTAQAATKIDPQKRTVGDRKS